MLAIGEVSRKTGLKVPTIRFYEAEGLMAAPRRSASGRRQYTDADVQRLTFVRQTRELGFELGDVRALLDLNDQRGRASTSVRKIVQRHLDAVAKRIARLKRLKRGLLGIARWLSGGDAVQWPLIEAFAENGRTFGQRDKAKISPPWAATLGHAIQHQATGGNAKVGPETRTFAYDTMRRLIERNPEFEKLFVA